jgi:hypothetical protein
MTVKNDFNASCIKTGCHRQPLAFGVFIVTPEGPRYASPCKIHCDVAVGLIMKMISAAQIADENIRPTEAPVVPRHECLPDGSCGCDESTVAPEIAPADCCAEGGHREAPECVPTPDLLPGGPIGELEEK